ncbi:MAG: hypothetical protein WDM80_06185 [Limisphaerales bacterium]
MFLATINKAKGLLHISYIGQVGVLELKHGHDDVVALLADLPAASRCSLIWTAWNPWIPTAWKNLQDDGVVRPARPETSRAGDS